MNDTSSFDAESFFASTEVQGIGDTEYPAIPINDEGYPATIIRIDSKEVVSTKTGETRIFNFLECDFEIDDPEVREATGMEKPRARFSVMLDLGPNQQVLMGPGKNVPLNRLRKALGQDDPNTPWHFNDLLGGVARVFIRHRVDERNGRIYNEVSAVTSL